MLVAHRPFFAQSFALKLAGRYSFKPIPIRHLPRRLVMRPGLANCGVQLGPFLRLVLGLEQVPDGAEAVGVALAGFVEPTARSRIAARQDSLIS